MSDFKKLKIWQNGIQLIKRIYLTTNDIPDAEKFGLTSQMRRAVVSIPSNIAEGSSRNSEIEFKRFLEISIGSAFELETQLIICAELEYLKLDKLEGLFKDLTGLQKQINSLISKITKAKG